MIRHALKRRACLLGYDAFALAASYNSATGPHGATRSCCLIDGSR
jgi:hypothetical protein